MRLDEACSCGRSLDGHTPSARLKDARTSGQDWGSGPLPIQEADPQ